MLAMTVGIITTFGVVGAGCSKSGSGTTANVTAANISFSPTTMTLKAGKKITFKLKNDDQIEHNLTIPGLKVNKDVKAGQTGAATVTPKAGTYPFHCEYHPQKMQGTITVT